MKNEKQRHRLLDQFMNAAVRGGENVDITTGKISAEGQSGDFMVFGSQDTPSTSNPLEYTDLPIEIHKVQKYLEDDSSYLKAPGVHHYSESHVFAWWVHQVLSHILLNKHKMEDTSVTSSVWCLNPQMQYVHTACLLLP